MADELKFTSNPKADRDSLDESLVSAIRDAYTPAGGDAYWASLEQRVMARVSTTERVDAGWYGALAPWARPALIAAAAIFAVAGVVNFQMADSESPVAYDSVIESATAGVGATSEELISVERGTEGAALSYYLSH